MENSNFLSELTHAVGRLVYILAYGFLRVVGLTLKLLSEVLKEGNKR